MGAAILGQPGGDPVSLRVGALSWVLAPRDLPLGQRFDWVIQDAPARGLDLVNGDPRPIFDWASMSIDLGHWADLRAQADAQSVEIDDMKAAAKSHVLLGARTSVPRTAISGGTRAGSAGVSPSLSTCVA